MKYTYEKFIKLLEETYQLTRREDGSLNFKAHGYTQKGIAKELLIDAADFSRMVSINREWKRYTSITKILTKQKEIRALKSDFKRENSNTVASIYTAEQFKAIYRLAGAENIENLTKEALAENKSNSHLTKDGKSLDENNAIQSMINVTNAVQIIIRKNRSYIKSLNFMVNGKKNIVDFVEHIMPIDSMFKLDHVLLATLELDNLPSNLNPTFYDIALLKSRKYLLEKNALSQDIMRNISKVTRAAQLKLEEENVKLFERYMKYGDSCFEK